ncbi:MAG: F0F1 ATP synthase subunit epsilon [Rikenellaceae bacterium]|nr:F0F1 ATP synthase subunit epsilon [Rikenellaceae bacterium]MCL2693238.1 F0F1 ATP synthase subunit epsilon [Rikenellaceae bacterium]
MSGKRLKLKIMLPTGKGFDGEVLRASFPGTHGRFAIHPGHAPLMSTLHAGVIKYTTPDEWNAAFKIDGGVIHVERDTITVCAD